MMRWLRRLFWLGVLTGAGYGGYRAVARRQSLATAVPSSSSAAPPAPSRSRNDVPVATPTVRWIAPDDSKCPAGYPIKVNENSGIYHVPGGRFYERTAADRCYVSAEDATADGYRPAKA